MRFLLLLLCALVFGNKLLSNFVNKNKESIENSMSEKYLDDSLQDGKVDPDIIDEDFKPIYPDLEDCIDLSDSLNLIQPGKSFMSIGKSSKHHQRLAEFYLDVGVVLT